MFGHHHHHRSGQRQCGPTRGRRSWGPFSVEWDISSDGPAGRGRGRMRVFAGKELRLILLKLIEETPRHGYDLIRDIEERTGGAYAPSPGVVYPTLTMLADMDLIAERPSDDAKKVFAITVAGQTYLTEHEEEVAALFERLASIGDMRERSRKGPVKRAMVNLREVLRDRVGEGAVEQDTLHAIADILDDAARRIERL